MVFDNLEEMKDVDISCNFIMLVEKMERLPKQKRYKLMRHLYERYANAYFGNGCDDVVTDNTSQGEMCRWLANLLAASMGFCNNFNHYTLEEIFVHPVQDKETVCSRVDELQKRCRCYFPNQNYMASAALRLAREAFQFYSLSKSKVRQFWKEVVSQLEKLSSRELSCSSK